VSNICDVIESSQQKVPVPVAVPVVLPVPVEKSKRKSKPKSNKAKDCGWRVTVRLGHSSIKFG
jgi:hypothetical protein